MITNTTQAPAAVSQPGNLSVRQLAKSLIAAPAAASPKKEETTEPPAATREVPAEENDRTELSQTEDPDQPQAEATETEPAAEQTAEEPAAETTEATEPEGTEENATLSEAMAQRIDAELAPLIEELTQAGAKGALQILQKRIPKLVDQRDTERNGRLAAEQQVTQLREELTEARSTKPENRNGDNPGVHPDVAKVMGELNNLDHWLGWCEANQDGGEVPDGDRGKVELSAQQVKAMHTALERERSELVARKVQTERDVKQAYQQQYQQHHTVAVTEYPWLTKANSPEHQEFQAVLKAAPGLKASPDFELMVADFIAGKGLRLAKAKAKPANGTVPRKPAPSREPTRVVAEPPASSAQRKAPEKAKKDEADGQFAKTGRMADLAKSFAASRRASRTGG